MRPLPDSSRFKNDTCNCRTDQVSGSQPLALRVEATIAFSRCVTALSHVMNGERFLSGERLHWWPTKRCTLHGMPFQLTGTCTHAVRPAAWGTEIPTGSTRALVNDLTTIYTCALGRRPWWNGHSRSVLGFVRWLIVGLFGYLRTGFRIQRGCTSFIYGSRASYKHKKRWLKDNRCCLF